MDLRGFDNTVANVNHPYLSNTHPLDRLIPGNGALGPDEPAFVPGFVPIRGERLLECELPPKGETAYIIDESNELADSLIAKGHSIQLVSPSSPLVQGLRTLSSPSYLPLYRPSRALELFLESFGPPSVESRRVEALSPLPLALDVGCGSGRDTAFLSRAGYRVVAVDRDPWVLENVLVLSRRYGLGPVDVVEGNARTSARDEILSVAEAKRPPGGRETRGLYDLVLMARFPFAPDSCAWAASILRPGGYLLLHQFERLPPGPEKQRPRPGICLEERELRELCGEEVGRETGDATARRGPRRNALGVKIVALERSRCEDGRPMLSVIMRRI